MKDDPLNRTKVKRGMDLPQAKLTDSDVLMIRELVCRRDELKKKAADLTNRKLAEKFDVHIRTIDKITAGGAWGHVQ